MYFSLIHAQTILCGMGELHIEIIHDRIKREYNIETHLGPLQVAYRETILQSATATGEATANSPSCFLIVYLCENHYSFSELFLNDRPSALFVCFTVLWSSATYGYNRLCPW